MRRVLEHSFVGATVSDQIKRLLVSLQMQHRGRYGHVGDEIELPSKMNKKSVQEVALRAFEYGLSLGDLACRTSHQQRDLWNFIIDNIDALIQESLLLESSSPKAKCERVDMNKMPRLWPSVPGELHLLVFAKLSAKDWFVCRRVCRLWKEYFFERSDVVSRVYQLWFGEAFPDSGEAPAAGVGMVLCARASLGREITFGAKPVCDAKIQEALEMRMSLLRYGLQNPPDFDSRDWFSFICKNVVLADWSCGVGTLSGRELHETPRCRTFSAWFPGYLLTCKFNVGTEGSSQTSWEAVRLMIDLKRGQKTPLSIDTNGVSLFDGYMTRYGQFIMQSNSQEKITGVLLAKHDTAFDCGMMLSFACVCFGSDRIIEKVRKKVCHLTLEVTSTKQESKKDETPLLKKKVEEEPMQANIESDEKMKKKCVIA